jgi:HEAT repeat protein/protein involved in polysaccharide export with SLBB domain
VQALETDEQAEALRTAEARVQILETEEQATSPVRVQVPVPNKEPIKPKAAAEKSVVKPLYRIEPFDVLKIRVAPSLPDSPIDQVYLVEPGGKVNLGRYGSLSLEGLTLDEAKEVVTQRMKKIIKDPSVSFSLVGWVGKWKHDPVRQHPYRIKPRHILNIHVHPTLPNDSIDGSYVVDPDGRIDLGRYEGYAVAGTTLEEAAEMVANGMRRFVRDPVVSIHMSGWEKDWQKLEDEESPLPGDERGLSSEKKASLRYGGKTFAQWRFELSTELKPAIRIDGIKALSTFGANGYGAEAAQAIVEVMRAYDSVRGDPDDQGVVAAGLEGMAKIGSPAVPVLLDALRKGDRKTRLFAVCALLRLRAEARPAISALLEAMRDKDPDIRQHAIVAVFNIDENAPGFADALGQILNDENGNVRRMALSYIQHLGARGRTAVPMLVKTLKDENPGIRSLTADALKTIGKGSAAAVPALVEALKDPDTSVRRSAAYALEAIRPEPKLVVSGLIEALKDQDVDVRHVAMNLLGRFGAEAKAAVPALIQALSSGEDMSFAISALGGIGPDANAAVPVLHQLLRGDKPFSNISRELRNAASEALTKIAPGRYGPD